MRRSNSGDMDPLDEPLGVALTDDEREVLSDPSVWAAAEQASERGGKNPRPRLA